MLLRLILLLTVLARAQEKTAVIVALGDSTTAGTPYFVPPLEAPPDGRGDRRGQYSYWMNRAMPGWLVLNRGIDGQRSDEILARFERDVLKERPRYVIILAGVNDVWQGAALFKTKASLSAMYERASQAGITPVAASVLPVDRANPKQNREIAELNAWIKKEAARRRIPFCDLHAAAAGRGDPTRLQAAAPDGLHPAWPVYRQIGETLARLVSRLESSKRKP